jgi:hypothetical protein
MRRIFPMKNHQWLSHAVARAGRPVRGIPGKPSARTPRIWAARGILMMALVLGGLGIVVAASSGHGQAGHASAVLIAQMPWMY